LINWTTKSSRRRPLSFSQEYRELAEEGFFHRCDTFQLDIEAPFDMPERTIDLLFSFLHKNGGRLSQRASANLLSRATTGRADLGIFPITSLKSDRGRVSARAQQWEVRPRCL
jgi:hypothetical protein